MKSRLAKITWFVPALVLPLIMAILFTSTPAEAG